MNSTYSPTNQNDDSKEEKSIKDIHTIELNYHLSDVNLLRGDFKKEELEVQHTNIEHENIKYLAKEIFSQWDLLDDGQISVDEIILCGIDTQLAVALGRVMDCDNSGVIHYEDIVNCLTILKFGTMKAKVALLVEFMDHNGDHMISYDEALTYLKAAPSEICEKLGLDPTNGKDLQFEDILALFESSDRGEEAIGVFCNHILHILESRVVRLKPMMSTVVHCLGINDVMMLYNQLATWVRHLSRENMFIAVLVALQIVLWEYNFNYYQENNYPVSFCIAKGFGLNLRILTIILFLTMARSTMAKLHSYKLLSYFVPMGFNIQIHSFVGFCTVFHALGHMSGHIVYHTYFVEGGFSHSFVQKSLLRGEGWRTKGSGDAITGFILLGALLLMAITALRRGNSSQAYKSFSLTHFCTTYGWCFYFYMSLICGLFFSQLVHFLRSSVRTTSSSALPTLHLPQADLLAMALLFFLFRAAMRPVILVRITALRFQSCPLLNGIHFRLLEM
mmetsp:Transcript_5179/g.7938  ORF Transcript_5179/g.7938 Transcript_5179/m.7938 type:complete len:504 (+) Transcript_5179:60-1571(+)